MPSSSGLRRTTSTVNLFQAHPASFGRLVQEGDAGLVVVRARGEDHRTDDQGQHVDGESPLPAGRLLVRVQLSARPSRPTWKLSRVMR